MNFDEKKERTIGKIKSLTEKDHFLVLVFDIPIKYMSDEVLASNFNVIQWENKVSDFDEAQALFAVINRDRNLRNAFLTVLKTAIGIFYGDKYGKQY